MCRGLYGQNNRNMGNQSHNQGLNGCNTLCLMYLMYYKTLTVIIFINNYLWPDAIHWWRPWDATKRSSRGHKCYVVLAHSCVFTCLWWAFGSFGALWCGIVTAIQSRVTQTVTCPGQLELFKSSSPQSWPALQRARADLVTTCASCHWKGGVCCVV